MDVTLQYNISCLQQGWIDSEGGPNWALEGLAPKGRNLVGNQPQSVGEPFESINFNFTKALSL